MSLKQQASNLSAPYIIGQSNIPIINISSVTMGANGAFTAATTLTNTYPSTYVIVPAGFITASGTGSAAGIYFCQWSSATAGTIFANTYTSGTPTIPASPTALVCTAGTGTQVTGADVVGYSLVIPAGLFQTNDSLRIRQINGYNNSAGAKNTRIKLGSSQARSLTGTTTQQWSDLSYVRFITQTSQSLDPSVGATNIGVAINTTLSALLSVDFTVAVTLTQTFQLAVATDYILNQGLTIERIPGVP